MHTFLRVLYLVAFVPSFGGILILFLLAPKPHRLVDHIQGTGRVLMLAGVLFSTAKVASGTVPSWYATALMLGISIGVAIYARENHLLAKAQERLEQAGRDAGA